MMLAAGGMALAMLSACHHSEKENYSHDVVTSTADVMEEIETPLKIADITHIRRSDGVHEKKGDYRNRMLHQIKIKKESS